MGVRIAMPPIIWILIDGLSYKLFELFVDSFPDSNLGHLMRKNRARSLVPVSPNCQTPPSLFTIWSGTAPCVHGLTGYSVPVASKDDPFAFVDAFSEWPKDIPLIWDVYAKHGHSVRLCSVPFVQPERLGDRLLSSSQVYGNWLVPPALLSIGQVLEVDQFNIRFIISENSESLVLTDELGGRYDLPDRGSLDIKLKRIDEFDLAPHYKMLKVSAITVSDRRKLFVHGVVDVCVSGVEINNVYEFAKKKSFCSSNPGRFYQRGELGIKRQHGGNGDAESVYAHLMGLMHADFSEEISRVVMARDAHLIVAYYPVIDLMSHQLLSTELPCEGGHFKSNSFLLKAMKNVDDWLGTLINTVDSGTRMIIHSDHGMAPVRWDIYPNQFFLEEGWLVLGPGKAIDPEKSVIFFHPAENGLVIYHEARAGVLGFDHVRAIEKLNERLSGYAVAALGLLKGTAPAMVNEWAAAGYLQAPAGARLKFGHGEALVSASEKGGDHTVFSDDPWLRGFLVDASSAECIESVRGELQLSSIFELVTKDVKRGVYEV